MVEFKSGDIIEYVRPDQYSGESKRAGRTLDKRLLRKLNKIIYLKGDGVPRITVTINGELSTEGWVSDWYLTSTNEKAFRSIKFNNKRAVLIWWFYGIIHLMCGIYNYFNSILDKNLGLPVRQDSFNCPNIFIWIILRLYLLSGIFPSVEVMKKLDIKHKWISM